MTTPADLDAASPCLAQGDVLTGLGDGMDALWQGLLARQSAITPTTRFPQAAFPVKLVAQIPGLPDAPEPSRAMAMLHRLLAPLAGQLDPHTPLLLATTVGEIEYVQHAATMTGAAAMQMAQSASPAILLGRVKTMLGLRGPGKVISSACASSTAAVAMAAAMVRDGQAEAVLVVAVDAVTEFVMAGFSALASLDERPARPFDVSRAGLSLGEAAAWALVRKPGHDPGQTRLLGEASSADASHMTAPDPTGTGLARAIGKACAMARRSPAQLDLIAAHGTATRYSDAMEMAAFRQVRPTPCPVFSIKGAVGHTLGAAGLVQLLVTQRALQQGIVPPTVGLHTPDDDAQGWALPAAVTLPDQPVRLALSTNSGFGGVNTAIVLGQETRR